MARCAAFESRVQWRALLLLAAIVLPSAALAEGEHVALDWARADGAEACEDAAALSRAVHGVLGRSAFGPREGARAIVHGRIERAPKGWIAHFVLSDLDGRVLGTRDLDTEEADCRRFDESLALVLALAVDSLGATPTDVLHDPPAPPSPPARTWRAEVGALAAGSYGLLPGFAGAVGVRAAVEPAGFWPIGVDARFWLPSSAEDRGRGASFSAWEVGLDLCAPIVRAVVEPRICGGFQVGQLRGEGYGLPIATASSAWLASFRLEATPLIHLGERFALAPSVGVAIPVIRDRFYFTEGADPTRRVLHQPLAAVFLFDLAVSVTIP